MADMYIKFKTIEGESTDKGHDKQIEIQSYSWGVALPMSGARSTGGAPAHGRCSLQDFTFTHYLDKASAPLFLACCKGDPDDEVIVQLHRAQGEKKKYMEYKMENVVVSSVSVGGGGGDIPMETVSLNFGKITLTYTDTEHTGGKGGGDTTKFWDQVTNEGG